MSQASPQRFPLPYAFARAHGVLLERTEGQSVLWVARSDAALGAQRLRSAMGEVSAHYTVDAVTWLERQPWQERLQGAVWGRAW